MQCFIETPTDIVSEFAFQNKDVPGTFRDWTRKLRQWLWNELTTAQKGCLGQKIRHLKCFYELDFERYMDS